MPLSNQWAARRLIAAKIACTAETLRKWDGSKDCERVSNLAELLAD